eukprot:TRINITY_DN10037_c0_g1_i2.p1 TRINITY_DN10037_c0_g1~~TRINITY_DN10037_c0_g1_i2.p1  ORF type:complete len:758 (-),score=149.60 TRINITY_DN10037_c0_g1_i2:476-2641(-)
MANIAPEVKMEREDPRAEMMDNVAPEVKREQGPESDVAPQVMTSAEAQQDPETNSAPQDTASAGAEQEVASTKPDEVEDKLLFAAHFGQLKVAEALLDGGASADAVDEEGMTALMEASHNGHAAVAEALLRGGASVDKPDRKGVTALMEASKGGHAQVVQLLIHSNASINLADNDGDTALSHALGTGRMEVASFLLDKGALFDARSLERCLKGGGAARACVLEHLVRGEEAGKSGTKRTRMGAFERCIQRSQWIPLEDFERAPVRLSDVSNQFATKSRLCSLFVISCAGDILTDNAVVEGLADADDEVLCTEFAEIVLQTAWSRVSYIFYIDTFLNLLYVATFCVATSFARHGETVPLLVLISMCVMLAKRCLEEVQQMMKTGIRIWRYIANTDNVLDLVFLSSSITATVVLFKSEGSLAVGEKVCVAFAAVQAWLRLLYGLRGFRTIGTRMLPIFRAVWTTKVFFLVVGLSLAAAVHGYYVLALRDDPSAVYAAIMQIARLGVLGDFELFEFEGLDVTYESDGGALEPNDPAPSENYVAAHALFISVAITITVCMMNLLIGVLGSNFDLYEDMAQALFLRSRAILIQNIRSRNFRFLPPCFCRICKFVVDSLIGPDVRERIKGNEEIKLWFAKPLVPQAEDLRSMRSVLDEKIKLHDEQFKQQAKQLSDIKDGVRRIAEEQSLLMNAITKISLMGEKGDNKKAEGAQVDVDPDRIVGVGI